MAQGLRYLRDHLAEVSVLEIKNPKNPEPANRRRARDRRPFADSAECERSRPGGGPRRRALGLKLERMTALSPGR